MTILTKAEIILFMNLLKQKTVIKPSADFPYRVTFESPGYSNETIDGVRIGSLQAKLSIMLELAGKQ